jgi:hypothetical protein
MNVRKTTVFVLLALLLSLATVSGSALAQEPVGPSTPVSDGGVVPVHWTDNPDCADIGNYFGYKDDGGPFTGSVDVTGDGVNDISWESSDGYYLSWSSPEFGIDAVIMKGGNNANVYGYDEGLGDSGLASPINPNTSQPYSISHVEFCFDYELEVSKTAEGTYDRTHTWDIEKSVNPTSQSGFAGDPLGWIWTVDLSESYEETNFAVDGTITIYNPAPVSVDFSVADKIDGSIVASVDCGGGAASGTVAAHSSTSCDYSAGEADGIDGTETSNEATVSSSTTGVGDGTATKDIDWEATVYNGTAVVDDDQESDFPTTVNAGEGPWEWTETQSHTCSTVRSDYGADGSYSDTRYNKATVNGSDGDYDESSAETTYTCKASFVDIYKTTNDLPADPTQDIGFDLFSGTDWLETVSTLGNGPDLEFQTALVPGDSYTICESPVPAGYTFEITVNGGLVPVPTYAGPPGAVDPTGEIQCFDFNAGDTGTTLLFEVNNSYPGGAPRTPGYWKNWSICSGGNQANTAAKLGGVEANVFLLDDLLPQTVGDFPITTCEAGVLILDSRSLDGKNRSNDAAYTLAKSLLAARLNQGANACVPVGTFDYRDETGLTFEQILTRADELLSEVGFDGTGKYLDPKNKQDADLRADGLYLYEIIDDYNNSELCTGEPSH